MDLGYNLFKKEPEKPLVKQPDLTVPNVYDPTKDVANNLTSQTAASAAGAPIGSAIAGAYKRQNTPVTKPVDPNSASDGIDVLKTYFTTPEEEERKRRASVANQRIAAVGDALRHIGNIYYTTKGAPAQKFNEPVKEEYERYQKEEALRDRNNQYYMTYQRAKAQQEALAAYNRERLEEAARANKARQEENVRYHDLYLDYLGTKENNRQEEKGQEIKIKQQGADDKTRQTNYNIGKPYYKPTGGGGGNGRKGGSGGNGETTTTTTTVVDDGKGNKKTTTQTTVKKKGAPGKKTLPQGKNTTKKTTKKQLP